jgi:TldD protein
MAVFGVNHGGNMKNKKKHREISRREFLGRSTAGLAALGFSSTLLNTLWLHTGCRSGAGAGEFLLPEDILRKAVGLLMAKGADFGEVFVERGAFDVLSSDDRKLNTQTVLGKGVGIRGVKDGKVFYAYTASFDPKEIYKTAQYVADAAIQGQASGGPTVVNLTKQTSDRSFPIVPLPNEVASDKKIEMIKELNDRAWSADGRVNQVSQYLIEFLRPITIATSSGQIIEKTLGGTLFYALTFMKDKSGNLQLGMDTRGAYAGMNFFKGENAFEVVVDKSVERAKTLLDAVDSPRGTFPVVVGPSSNGVLFHESCGHGMEADLVYKGSNYRDQLGKQTAARGVTLIDDGTIHGMLGSYTFDDEGTPAQRTVLIRDGIQENYMCDLVWAQKLGLKSTGSGRRQSFRYPPIPRMRNTFIDAGDVSPQDIIANTKRGIYVVQVGGGGEVDVITGNFMMGVAEAYLIEKGKITNPIKGAILSGMGIEALKTIDMVGNDLSIFQGAGQCGKGQTVYAGFGMPTIRVRGILVGGPGEAWEDIDGGLR